MLDAFDLLCDSNNLKRVLMYRARHHGVYKHFGEHEYRTLESATFPFLTYGKDEDKRDAKEILNDFRDFIETYTN